MNKLIYFSPTRVGHVVDCHPTSHPTRRASMSAFMPTIPAQTSAATVALKPAKLFDMLADEPTCLIVDCRLVLRTGLLPRSRVLRCKGKETLRQALDRVIETCMWEDPPADQSRAILVSQLEDEGEDVAAILGVAAAYLRETVGCKEIFTLAGGAAALARDPRYRCLLGMTQQQMEHQRRQRQQQQGQQQGQQHGQQPTVEAGEVMASEREVEGGHLAASRMIQEQLLASLPAVEESDDDDHGDYAG